jgi:hypothetical protein
MRSLVLADPGAARRVRVRRYEARHVSIGLWLPLTALVVLLGPFALIAAPLGWLWRDTRRRRPVRAVWAMGRVLLALSGTRIEVDAPRARIRLHIV